MKTSLNGWTDYPIEALGDVAGKEAPVRACQIVAYDGDKYATVIVEGVTQEIKAGYLYMERGRYGEAARYTLTELSALANGIQKDVT